MHLSAHRAAALVDKPAQTVQEVTRHALAIASAATKEHFVSEFAAYVADVVARETEPCKKVGLFVLGMVEGLRETVVELMLYRGGGSL